MTWSCVSASIFRTICRRELANLQHMCVCVIYFFNKRKFFLAPYSAPYAAANSRTYSTCVCVCTYICMYVHVCVCMYVYKYVCAYVYTHIIVLHDISSLLHETPILYVLTYMHTRVRARANTHIHTQIRLGLYIRGRSQHWTKPVTCNTCNTCNMLTGSTMDVYMLLCLVEV